MDLNANDFSAKQLRAWLCELGKPTWGSKPRLVMRLNEIAADERGVCPIVENEADENTVDEDPNDSDNSVASNAIENNNADVQQQEGNVIDENENVQLELESIRKELENLRKECKLLERENALLTRNKGGKRVAQNNIQQNASISLLKEIMIEYDGEVNVDIWIGQFKDMGETYNADTNTLRALFVSKMKGKAQQWLQQVPNYVSKHLDQLLDELKIFFSNKTNKLKLRKAFENRKWNHQEPYIKYCNEKLALANTFNIPEDEFVEYVEDGIPDPQLRTQASLMCITSTAQLIRAFANIEFKPPNRVTIGTSAAVRCFNCNSSGHYATECRKPKREPGSCYVCGSKDHIAVNCQQRKKPVMTVEDREYNDYNV